MLFPAAPTIKVEVAGSEPILGQEHSIHCAVSGADSLQPTMTYQWFHNGGALSECTATLSFSSLVTSDGGEYSCQVTLTSALLERAISVSSGTHTISLPGNDSSDCMQCEDSVMSVSVCK